MQSDHDARLFVTLWPDDTVRAALRAYRKQWQWPRSAAAMHSEKFHLTLHFLGAQPRTLLPALADALNVPMMPFDLAFGHAEVWRHGSAVLAPSNEPPALLALHGALGRALASVGITPEARPFRPHVTMGRQANGAIPPHRPPHVHWHVNGFALVESAPDHGGYTILRRYPY